MLFFVVRLSHYGEFKVEHTFPNQLFCRSSFNHHHVLPGACLSCTNTTYFISVSVAVGGGFNSASKKNNTAGMSIHFLTKSFLKKQTPLP